MMLNRSPQSTAEIFRSIATHHDPVDVQKAVAVGGGAENKDNEEEWVLADPQDREGSMEDNEDARQAATNILLSLPGINVHNFREVMHQVENLAELAKMSEKQLAPMIGQANAMKLVAFFRQRIL